MRTVAVVVWESSEPRVPRSSVATSPAHTMRCAPGVNCDALALDENGTESTATALRRPHAAPMG